MVFGTIIDNIKSFFRREDELLKEPQAVPDAASEVLGGDISQPVVEKKLPASAAPRETTPELPFSAQELQNAFRKKQAPSVREPEPTVIKPHEIHELESEYVSDEDLAAFEETMNQVHEPVSQPVSPSASSSRTPLKDGFFSSFQDFIEEGNFDPSHLDGDLLHKMRVFHQRRQEGKEPLLHKESANELLRRRLSELQVLEHEWERFYAESRDAERSMIHLEEEIDEKTKALRSLLSESQKLALLAEEVPSEQAFVLANGAKVYSLGGLLRAVRKDSWLFGSHVRADRNDFAAWTRHVLQKPDLADQIEAAKSPDDLLLLLHS